MEPFYRLIFKRALLLSWKHKWLWLFGFFAAFIGNGSVYEALLRSFNNLSDGRSLFATLKEYSQTGALGLISWTNITSLWIKDSSAVISSLFTLLLFLSVLALIVSIGVICQGGLIRALINLDRGKVKITDKSGSFKIGVEHFWPILEINVITKVIFFGILLLIVYIASLFAANNYWIYGLAMVIFVALGIIIYFLTIYGTAFIVLRKQSVWQALAKSWDLFRRHSVLNLEMGLLLFGANILACLAVFTFLFIILSPLFLFYLMFVFSGASLAAGIMVGIMLAIAGVLLALVGAWWTTFQLGCWVILFEELTMKGGMSKITRILHHMFKK